MSLQPAKTVSAKENAVGYAHGACRLWREECLLRAASGGFLQRGMHCAQAASKKAGRKKLCVLLTAIQVRFK